MELAKGSLLLEAIRELKARKIAQIPDSILQKEQVLKIQISYLKGEIYYQVKQGKYKDIKRIVELESQLKAIESKHETLIQQIEKQHPKYYALKYDFSTIAVSDLQQLLKPKEVLLNYSLMDSVLLVLTVTQEGIQSKQVPLVKRHLKYRIERFLQGVQDMERDEIAKRGYKLYQQIWEPLEAIVVGRDPIIIPDGWLNNLSFEALPTDQGLHYLLEDYAMVYNYSATVWAINHTKDLTKVSTAIAGFAPDYEQINSALSDNSLTYNYSALQA